MSLSENCFTHFQEPIDNYSLPQLFTFPFNYTPHPLCVLAAMELQEQLKKNNDISGKMFGVLVVKNTQNEIGYLSAFSGKLLGSNHHKGFVPPVFDIFIEGNFFEKGSDEINAINKEIEVLEKDTAFISKLKSLNEEETLALNELTKKKTELKEAKTARKVLRKKAKLELTPLQFEQLTEKLKNESLGKQFYFKQLNIYWEDKLAKRKKELAPLVNKLSTLKELRKTKSAALQQQLFDHYNFLNINGEEKNLSDIFKNTVNQKPPAAAGECAAPKLLQYAFKHNLTPIAMAEFWWGDSPKSEIKKHGNYYPACRGKCEPILGHMLQGINMDENPMLINLGATTTIKTVFEDEHLVIINKPAELLSVPGKSITDSVATRMKAKYPEATGPLVVHRLDMSTSGLMLIAKNNNVHKHLQNQFIKRTIKKQYVALLDGVITANAGTIDLPLRVDLNDRPRQLVCYEHGKAARTNWQVIDRKENKTRIHFFPVTGRTHQLRVHASHPKGLNSPIVGDDLYGIKTNRLHLHAESITFIHPTLDKEMTVKVDAEF